MSVTSNVTSSLPVQLTSFVGRERELAELGALLDSTRLLTLTGAGGCGKTRLALRLAADRVDCYPGGAWCLELAPLSDPALIESALATMLGARRPTVTLVAKRLQARGLIDYRRGRIVIRNRPGLARLSCECYGVVRAQFERLVP